MVPTKTTQLVPPLQYDYMVHEMDTMDEVVVTRGGRSCLIFVWSSYDHIIYICFVVRVPDVLLFSETVINPVDITLIFPHHPPFC